MTRRKRKRRPSDTRPRPKFPVDVTDRGDEFVITADLPGIRTQDIDVRVRNDRVQIVVDPDGVEGRAGSFARKAQEYGPLSRTLRLPANVDERHTDAEFPNGRLRVTLRKRERRRSIEIERGTAERATDSTKSPPTVFQVMNVELFGRSVELDADYVDAPETDIRTQLAAYAAGERRRFDLSVRFADGFTGEVMAAMAEIPYGETRTYGDIAGELDTAPVAVGRACGRNPVPLVVPCHRVVGADSLGGYSAGDGTALKARLLEHEADVTDDAGGTK